MTTKIHFTGRCLFESGGPAGPQITHQGLRAGRTAIESARHSFAMRFALPLFVLLFPSWTPAPGLAEAAPVSISRKPVPALDLFEKGEIPRVRLELSDDALA